MYKYDPQFVSNLTFECISSNLKWLKMIITCQFKRLTRNIEPLDTFLYQFDLSS